MNIESLMSDELRQAAALEKGAKHKAHELDFDVMRKLYDFGGLNVYRVTYFDPILFKVTSGYFTFNEETAQAEIDRLKRAGFTAGMESFIVKFDGAFAKRQGAETAATQGYAYDDSKGG